MGGSVRTIAQVDRYRQAILTAAYNSRQPQHLASAMSCIHLMHILFDRVMQPADTFILSKGHAALALYAVLATGRGIGVDEFMALGSTGSRLGGHPDREHVPEVVASTGSLGTGIGMAVGMAWARKMSGTPGTVYCLAGDGEMQEGSALEALDFAHSDLFRGQRTDADTKINYNLCVVVDSNGTHDSHLQRYIPYQPLREVERVLTGFTSPVTVVKTIKGHGIREMELDPGKWHRRALTEDEYTRFMKEVADASCHNP